ncbi:hypothetical protein HpBGD81_14630 [Helicobacter pylori]
MLIRDTIDIDLEDFFNMYLEYADPSASKKRADKGLKKVFKDSKKTLAGLFLFLIQLSEPTKIGMDSFAGFCLEKKKINIAN